MMIIMRYPASHKAQVRARIIEAAADALRKRGLAGVSIPALMKEVGLTHGGFYSHFKNRDELVAAAVRAASEQTAHAVFAEGKARAQVMAGYLSKQHVDRPDRGCVVAALGAEGVRQAPRVRAAFAEVALGLLHLADRERDSEREPGELGDATLVDAATMVGAVVLARLVRDPALSERILNACRAAVTA